MAVYVGRGELKLDTVSVGLSTDLTLSLEFEEWRRESWDSTFPGGPESISIVPTKATIEVALNDFIYANLAKLVQGTGAGPVDGMAGTGTEYALEFAGINKADSCSTLVIAAPKFLPFGSDLIQLISEDFVSPILRGEILRTPGGSPEWFTVTVT